MPEIARIALTVAMIGFLVPIVAADLAAISLMAGAAVVMWRRRG